MVIEVGLVLLVTIGFVVGPLLLWPRWALSHFAQASLVGGGITATLLLAVSIVYAATAFKRNSRCLLTLLPRLMVPLLTVALVALYFLPALTLPPVDPTSKPLLMFGPTDEVQMLMWTTFTVFLYVPVTLASLFWHIFTILFLRAYGERYLQQNQGKEGASKRQTVVEG